MSAVPVASVVVGERHRRDMGNLDALAQSIRDEGLLQPIGITSDNHLVFGERRLRACADILGWTEIEARVVAVSSIAAGEYAENEVRKDFTPSERVAITDAVRAEIGNRQGQRTDLTPDDEDDEPDLPIASAGEARRKHLDHRPEVRPGQVTRSAAAKLAGFGSDHSYRDAKAVVERGTPELVAKMDRGEVSISTAAEIAKLPSEAQTAILTAKPGEERKALKQAAIGRPLPTPAEAKLQAQAASTDDQAVGVLGSDGNYHFHRTAEQERLGEVSFVVSTSILSEHQSLPSPADAVRATIPFLHRRTLALARARYAWLGEFIALLEKESTDAA